MAGRLRTGGIAAWTLVFGLVAAVVCWFAIPDSHAVALIILGVTLLDVVFLALILPRFGEDRAASEIDRLNAEAEAADQADDDVATFEPAPEEITTEGNTQ